MTDKVASDYGEAKALRFRFRGNHGRDRYRQWRSIGAEIPAFAGMTDKVASDYGEAKALRFRIRGNDGQGRFRQLGIKSILPILKSWPS